MLYTRVSSSDLTRLAAAVVSEENGQDLLRDLRRNLREAVKPAEAAAKSSIMAMPSTGLRSKGGSLRAAIRKEIKAETRLSTRSAGVTVRVRRRAVRGFKNPAKRLNSSKPWRHPILPFRRVGGRTVPLPRSEWTWVQQRSPKPGWFDDAMRGHRAEYEAAVRKAMNNTADRIARKV